MWKKIGILLLITLKIELTFGQNVIIINEIMFDAPSFTGDTYGEWVELYNPNPNDIVISKWKFNDGGQRDKIIPSGTITAYGYLVLVEKIATFTTYPYPNLINIVEIGRFSLDDSMGTLTLKDDDGNIIDKLSYDKNWGVGTANSGRTLEKIYPMGSNTDFYWKFSKTPYGTPGGQNSVYVDVPAIQGVKLLINEIMFSDDHDWVEVYCVDDGQKGNGVQIKGFYFNNDLKDEDKNIGTCTIRGGEFLLLYYGITGEDETFGVNGKINLFTDTKSITSTTDQMIFYNPLDEIVDAVCWANDSPPPDEEKQKNAIINLGKWQGETIDSTKVSKGQSIVRNSNIDTDTRNDWYVSSISTPGLPNNMTSQSAKPPEIKVVRIINKTFAPEEGKKTTIIYSLSKTSEVSSRIYDIRGRLVKRLIDQEYKIAKEENVINWDGRDENGKILPTGVYICYLEAVGEDGASSDKVVLILAKRL